MLKTICVLIVGLGSLGQSLFGFGGGLIIVPLVTLLLGIKTAVSLALFFQLAMGIILVPALKHIRWAKAVPALITLLPFTVLGIWMFERFHEGLLRVVLMAFIGLFLFNKLWFPEVRLVRPTPAWGAIAGVFGGILQGVLGTGGPPLVIYFSEETELNKQEFRAMVMFLLFVTNLVRFGVFWSRGLFSAEVKELGLLSMPLVLLTLFLGEKVHTLFSERLYRICVYSILGLSFLSLGYKLLLSFF